MPVQDRTTEFRTCVESIRSRQGPRGSDPKQRLMQAHGKTGSKSDFSRMAGGIGKDINSTDIKLGKLGQLAKRKTLFDDRPVEISELTYIIKQDIANINKQIAALQAYIKQRPSPSSTTKGSEAKQIEEHHSNVAMLLQSRLAATSMTFKDVLEIRTMNMKASKDRTEQFMYSTASAASQPPSNSFLFNQNRQVGTSGEGFASGRSKGKSRANGDLLALDLDAVEEGEAGAPIGNSSGGAFQQMQLIEQQDSYIQSRSTAIESIESTIAELGQIFSQLANMVAEQRETVQRIDADTLDIAANVGGAQKELLKYYASMTGNRWLMLKVFGVLIVFFLLFILVS